MSNKKLIKDIEKLQTALQEKLIKRVKYERALTKFCQEIDEAIDQLEEVLSYLKDEDDI